MKRTATAVWKGSPEGQGELSSLSGALKQLPYSFKTRFENEEGTAGTNPEELVAAAHAGCFAMALSLMLSQNNTPPDELRVEAAISLEKKEAGFTVTKSALSLQGKVPQIEDAKFQELARKAKENCPISRLLKCEITLDARLG
jgi:osmotically inducible protein OsmC